LLKSQNLPIYHKETKRASLGRYLWWWTISPRWYHQPSSQCFGTDMVYYIFITEIHSS